MTDATDKTREALIARLLRRKGISSEDFSFGTAPRESHRSPVGGEETFVFPASFSQELYWLNEQREPGNPFYGLAMCTRVRGEMDRTVLEQSLHALVRQHEIL